MSWWVGPAAKSFRLNQLVKIPPHATAKIAVLPTDPFPAPIGGRNRRSGPITRPAAMSRCVCRRSSTWRAAPFGSCGSSTGLRMSC